MSDFRNDRIRRATRGGSYGRPAAPQPNRPAGGRHVRPVWFLVIMDLLILGLAFNIYGIIMHQPSELNTGGMTLPTPSAAVTMSTKPTPSPAPSQSAEASASASQTEQATATPDATATDQPADQGMWGAKFADKFTGGDIEKTDNSYKSHDINVTWSKQELNGSTYFLADIYIRNLQNLKAGLANGKPLSMNQGEMTDAQAKRYNAVIAINGDNYGDHVDGMVVRNGEFGRDKSFGDVCVLNNDGTMKTFSKNDFKMSDIQSSGAWQVWGFGPMLLDSNGKAMTKFDSIVNPANPRTAIGYYEPGHYCFLVVDGRQPGYSSGLTTTDTSKLFEDLGCKAAYNLDGGRTTEMAFMGNMINKPYAGGRSTSDIIYIGEAN